MNRGKGSYITTFKWHVQVYKVINKEIRQHFKPSEDRSLADIHLRLSGRRNKPLLMCSTPQPIVSQLSCHWHILAGGRHQPQGGQASIWPSFRPKPSFQTDLLFFLRCPSCDRCLLSFGGRRWWPPSAPRSPESCLTLFSSFWGSLTWRRQ